MRNEIDNRTFVAPQLEKLIKKKYPSFNHKLPTTRLREWITIFDPADYPFEITPEERDDIFLRNLCEILYNLECRDD